MKALFIFLCSLTVLACPLEQQPLTTNDISYVPIDAKVKSDMTEHRFLEILKWFQKHYDDEIRAHGAELKIISDWKESMANAFAQREDNTWIIRVLGGLARHHMMTEDAFILVLCHEMGHHIGGAPKKKYLFRTSWASTEGQADYYASLKCMRKLFATQDNVSLMRGVDVHPIVTAECRSSFIEENKIALCKRTAMASLSFGRFLNRRNQDHDPVSFDTPDTSTIRRTTNDHPKPQCRLDTSFSGAICPVNLSEQVSQYDPVSGTCHSSLGFERGLRSTCWYRN